MARPKMDEAEKKQSLSFRLSPASKDRIAKAAAENGHGIPSEVESRIERFISYDEPTLKLLSLIGREIERIESSTKKSWTKDLKTWGAVNEALTTGLLSEMKPTNPVDEEYLKEAYAPISSILERKFQIIKGLEPFGVRAALLATRSQQKALYGNISNRDIELASLSALPEDAAAEALTLHRELVDLDTKQDEAMKYFEQVKSEFDQAEQEGAELYRSLLSAEARFSISRGDWGPAIRLLTMGIMVDGT